MFTIFSDATIVTTLTLIERWDHDSLTTLFLKYGLLDIAPKNTHSKKKRINKIIQHIINNPNTGGILTDSLAFDILSEIIEDQINKELYDEIEDEFYYSRTLSNLLRKDGFVIRDEKLIRVIDSVVNMEEKESLLFQLLDKHNLNVPKGHLNQAMNSYTIGDWSAANAQLRSYTEGLLKELAEKITGKTFESSHNARMELSKTNPPLFYRTLNEWDDNGTGYMNVFYKRLHPEGSHPGLSNKNDCTFRLNLIMITTVEIFRRYDEHYG